MRNFRFKKAFAMCSLFVLVACGKDKTGPTGFEQYVCNKIGAEGAGSEVDEYFSCYDAKTFEVCTVVADAATGKRIHSNCLGHQ